MSFAPGPSFLGIKRIDLSDDAAVEAGNDVTKTLQPSKGLIYQIINLYASMPDPSGSNSGEHSFRGKYSDSEQTFMIKSDAGSGVHVRFSRFEGDVELPSGYVSQFDLIKRTEFASNSIPYEFRYVNDTDVAQSGTRAIIVIVKVYKELI